MYTERKERKTEKERWLKKKKAKKHLVGICFPQLLPLALFPFLYSYKALKYYSLSSMHSEIASECYDLEGGEFVEKSVCVCV